MNPISYLADLLRSLPEPVRKVLYGLFAVACLAVQICLIFGLDLPYDQINQTLSVIGLVLGFTALSNVGVTADHDQ